MAKQAIFSHLQCPHCGGQHASQNGIKNCAKASRAQKPTAKSGGQHKKKGR